MKQLHSLTSKNIFFAAPLFLCGKSQQIKSSCFCIFLIFPSLKFNLCFLIEEISSTLISRKKKKNLLKKQKCKNSKRRKASISPTCCRFLFVFSQQIQQRKATNLVETCLLQFKLQFQDMICFRIVCRDRAHIIHTFQFNYKQNDCEIRNNTSSTSMIKSRDFFFLSLIIILFFSLKK